VLFERRLREGIHEDRIVLAFRRWRRGQVVAGHRYRTGLDLIEVSAVDVIAAADIDDAQAREAGFATAGDVLAVLRGADDLPLYRIRFRRLDELDPRDTLASAASLTRDEMAAVAARLARMDRSSARGPWTTTVLALIADRPATAAAALASSIGWARPDFKRHVRRLKDLGLTISLDVGYKLSPRGEAYTRGGR
jgi:biotin operon repressor